VKNSPITQPASPRPFPCRAKARIRDCSQILAHFDTTPHRYLEQLRLQTACSALRQRNAQVKSIALQLGFGDSSPFSHWFRRRTGISPRAFRNQLLF
jgi:AraC-like DNA-binding protein